MRDQTDKLKEAFRADVLRLAEKVEELRHESLKANVYARTSTRLLREQNALLKQRVAHNALLAAQRQCRLRAWVGWKLVVHSGRARMESSEQQLRDVNDRDSMISHLEDRLAESRSQHVRQLRVLQETHESDRAALQGDLEEARGAIARLQIHPNRSYGSSLWTHSLGK